jgi:hypothetical protein
MAEKPIVLQGHLRFTYRGQRDCLASAKVTCTRTSEEQFTCDLEVTYEGHTKHASFIAPALANPAEVQKQKDALAQGIRTAVSNWTDQPWISLRGIVIDIKRVP